MERCDYCKSDKLVEFHGDYTCTECGVVKYTHMIDDTYSNHYDDMIFEKRTSKTSLTTVQVSKEIRKSNMFKYMLDKLGFDDNLNKLALEWFEKAMENKINCHGMKTQYIMGICIYCASLYLKRGFPMQQIAYKMSLHYKHLWKYLPKVLETWEKEKWYTYLLKSLSSHSDKLTRTVYEIDCIPDEIRFKVLKNAKSLYEKMSICPKFNVVKSHTLIASCIFIGCLVAGCKLKRGAFCKEIGISLPTLKIHETMIQEVLTNSI